LNFAETSQLVSDRSLADYYEATAKASGNPRAAANWIRSELLRELEASGKTAAESPVPAEELGALIRLIDEGKISGKQAKDVLVEMFSSGKGALAIIDEQGLVQVSDTGEIDALVDQVIAANPDQLASYRGGKETLFGFFVGQVIKASKGKANPKIVNERLRAKLSG
jgi:aspartyl-tRNA(Asn)/glutamyl-tRNA(Gln) amidotransferase subunit B